MFLSSQNKSMKLDSDRSCRGRFARYISCPQLNSSFSTFLITANLTTLKNYVFISGKNRSLQSIVSEVVALHYLLTMCSDIYQNSTLRNESCK